MEDDESPIDRATPLGERVEAVEEFLTYTERLLRVGELKWDAAWADFRLLAVNSVLRRQQESIRAAALLCRQDLGHLAVAFVRASLEDVMYLGFFASLKVGESQRLFLALGNWDSLRSLLAQRKYIGDKEMARLWYPQEFLSQAASAREEVRAELKLLQKRYRWAGGTLPSAEWVADRAAQRELYDYLHAATSRSLHFSAGEIMRRAWGEPSGNLVTDKPEFREHLASFAIDRLWRLYVDTWRVAMPLMEHAGISSDPDLTYEEMRVATERLNRTGTVPLVHAREWNLTPHGPIQFQTDDEAPTHGAPPPTENGDEHA